MLKVQVFAYNDPHILTSQINEWLSQNNSIAIYDKQISGTGGSGHGKCWLVIWYRDEG